VRLSIGGDAGPKNKKSPLQRSGLLSYSRQRPTLPRTFARSTIGGGRLNFRVRNGNGCDPAPMTTGKLVGKQRQAVLPDSETALSRFARYGLPGVRQAGAQPSATPRRPADRPRRCQRTKTTEYPANGSSDLARTVRIQERANAPLDLSKERRQGVPADIERNGQAARLISTS
jgi:hypothetical protein